MTTTILMNESGDCFETFLESLQGSFAPQDLERIRTTADGITRKCIGTYQKAFGSGAVGRQGSGTTTATKSDTREVAKGTTGLLYGKVQSGKTAASVASIALGSANGFRCFVVLTSDNVWLGHQTYDRFLEGLQGGPVVIKWTDWAEDPDDVVSRAKAYAASDGVLFLSTKNVTHLKALEAVLRRIDAFSLPGIIIDDEADNASLNTNESKSTDPSRVFEHIGNIRKLVPHHVYLQVTATPQSLLLQSIDHECRPRFCELLPPGEGYIGGETLFADDNHYCQTVDAEELQILQGKVTPGKGDPVPSGLRTALCTFIVGTVYKQLSAPDDKYLFLAHICYKRINHQNLKGVIRRFLLDLDKALREPSNSSQYKKTIDWLERARVELSRTAGGIPELEELLPGIRKQVKNISPDIINADNPAAMPAYKKGMNILIGGNRLGRGVTIPGLTVTYYGRDAKNKMMDTVHQHARMFGYREHLLNVTRFFTSTDILTTFEVIHDADEGMREQISGGDPSDLKIAPVWVGPKLKATRSNVLNPSEIGAFAPGRQIFPADMPYKASEINKRVKELDRLLAPYLNDEVYHEVPLDLMIDILKLIPTNHYEGYTWRDDRVIGALKALQSNRINIKSGRLNVRRGKSGAGLDLSRQDSPAKGYASSGWVNKAKQEYSKEPTLLVLKQKGLAKNRWDNHSLYIPVLVMPKGKFAITFNLSD